MNSRKKRPVIIWTPTKGTWYQEIDNEQLSLSFLGWAMNQKELREFCAKHEIEFVVYERDRAKV